MTAVDGSGVPVDVSVKSERAVVEDDKITSDPNVYQLEDDSTGTFLAVLAPQGIGVIAKMKEPKPFTLTLEQRHSGIGRRRHDPCAKVRVNLVLQPHSATPLCPWDASAQRSKMESLMLVLSGNSETEANENTKEQMSANDHLGSILGDLVPRELEHLGQCGGGASDGAATTSNTAFGGEEGGYNMLQMRGSSSSSGAAPAGYAGEDEDSSMLQMGMNPNGETSSGTRSSGSCTSTKTKMIWLDSVHGITAPFHARASAALRVEVTVQPPWLPLKVKLFKKSSSRGGLGQSSSANLPQRSSSTLVDGTEDLSADAPPVATATAIESRLLLIEESLDAGDYELKFLTVTGERAADMSRDICAHVTISVDAFLVDLTKIDEMRDELVDTPDLQPVMDFPRHLNAVGLFDPRLRTVTFGVFRFPDPKKDLSSGGAGGDPGALNTLAGAGVSNMYVVSALSVAEPTLFRISGEPADLVSALAGIEIYSRLLLEATIVQDDR